MKNKVNNYFDKITPIRSDEEILTGVLRKAEEMERTKCRHKLSFKRPVIAVCATVLALSLGVTGAAAAGIIDFNEIFDKRIAVQNEELGNALMCSAEGFTYTISDDAYQIEMQGLTGTEHEIMGTLVISRKDGAPVTDYINAVSKEDKIVLVEEIDSAMYPTEEYSDFCYYGGAHGEYYTDNNGKMIIEFSAYNRTNMYNNKIRIYGQRKYLRLPFDWSVEFVYAPSETVVERLHRGYFTVDDKVPVTYWVSDTEMQEQMEKVETMADIYDIELNSLNGTITGTSKLPEEWIYKAAGRECFNISDFEVYLTQKDGTKVNAFIQSGGYTKNKFDLTLVYINGERDELIENETLDENHIAVDLSEIKSITINGKTFDMQ